MGKLADEFEKKAFKLAGAGWRNNLSLVNTYNKCLKQDELNEETAKREKEHKKVREEKRKEQVILTLEAKIQEVASRQPKTVEDLETEITELLNSKTVDVAKRFKELARVQYLLKDYYSKISALEVQESHQPYFDKKIQELVKFGVTEDVSKPVLVSKTKELAEDFKILMTALRVIKSRRRVKE